MKNKQVILIMTDTQRKDMLGCYSDNLDMGTPYLDSLAAEGIRFERAYTCQPVCGPARSSIFTGTYPHTNGMLGNSMSLNQLTKTIGQRLSAEGIETAYIGKWHLDGGDYFGNGICPEGWNADYWYDMRNYLDNMGNDDRYKSRQFDSALIKNIPEEFTFAYGCSNRAVEFIKKNKNKDYLLVVSYDEPHHPYLAPQKYYENFKNCSHINNGNLADTLDNKPEHIKVWSAGEGEIDSSAYGLMGCNSYVDSEIGRVLEAAEKFSDEAMLIYTSDHGDALGAHGITNKGPAMYEEITNIPFIIKWKDIIEKNLVLKHPVSHIDIVPTILGVFGLPVPECLEGKSLSETLINPEEKANEYVFIEFTRYEIDHDGFGGYQPIRAVTDGRYKLVVNLLTTDELYDNENDPGEMKNQIINKNYMEIRNKLHDVLLKWMNDTRDPFRGYYWERRPWRTDARPATWDYTGMTRQRAIEAEETGQLDYLTGLPYEKRIRGKGVIKKD